MSWAEVDRVEPVIGNAGEFDRVAQNWRAAQSTASSLSLTFDGIVADTSTIKFEGQTANAFQAMVAESASVLDEVPQVCADIAMTVANHAVALRALEQEANAALARARTAWNDKRQSQTAANAAHGRVAGIQRQIRSLQGYPPEQVEPTLRTLRYNLSVEQRNASNHEYNATLADRRLQQEYGNRDNLASSERDLNRRTANSLRRVDLRSLKDPGLLDRLAAAGNALREDVAAAWAAAGDFIAEHIWQIRKVLEYVGLALGALVFVLAIASVACPFLLPVVALVAFAALAVSAAKLALTATLFTLDVVDPETGRPLGVLDVGFDALGLVMSFGGMGTALRGSRVVFSKLGSAPMFSSAGGELVRSEFRAETARIVRNSAIVGFAEDLGVYAGDSVVGSGPTHRQLAPHVSPIGSQTRQVQRPNRGLSSPCRPVLVPAGGGW